jgi:hypothetical protein
MRKRSRMRGGSCDEARGPRPRLHDPGGHGRCGLLGAPAAEVHVDNLNHRHDPHGLPMIGMPLVSWRVFVFLWDAHGLIATIGFPWWGFAWLCRRYPLVAWFILGFLRGLLRR